jgi:CBS domain-containing protein
VSPDTAATALISDMARPGANSRFMVVEDDHLVGIVSLRDLKEYIALKLDLESNRG